MRFLNPSRSICRKKQEKIKCAEKGNTYIAENVDRCNVRQYRIDGDILSSTEYKKCDFMVLNDDKKAAYYIELKGSKLTRAIKQLEDTYRMLNGELPGYTSHFRIVYSSGTKSLQNADVIEWKVRRSCIIKNKHYTEEI